MLLVWARSERLRSSSGLYMVPHGLEGLLMMMARVSGVMDACS